MTQLRLAKEVVILLLLLGATNPSFAQIAISGDPAVGMPEDRLALAATVDQLCGKEVALLGEATHADGHTSTFKVALVQQLVTRCHYQAVYFEGSYYEFESIARARREGRVVTPDMVGAAVGGLWKLDREFQPLLPFLAKEATSGRLVLGGIDFQTSGFEEPYTNDRLPAELSRYLDSTRQVQCHRVMRERIYNGYEQSAQAELLQCLSEISQAIKNSPSTDAKLREEQNRMLVVMQSYFVVDAGDSQSLNQARDRAMFDIFRTLKNRLPLRSKVIVWSASAHIAKDATAYPPFASAKNFGAYVHETYGDRAFSLGFTAYGGTFRWSRQDDKPLPPVPADSVEASAFAKPGTETVLLAARRLRQIGPAQGGIFFHEYRSANWAKVLDGIVVFRTEYPPHSTRP
ncbi:MAG: erythromycin esterase family protein, partial [Novosphingobium sp.]